MGTERRLAGDPGLRGPGREWAARGTGREGKAACHMLTTTVKKPPPIVWLRRNKSLHCLRLAPPIISAQDGARAKGAVLAPLRPHRECSATLLSPLSLLSLTVPNVPMLALCPGRWPCCEGPRPLGEGQAAWESLPFFLLAGAGMKLSRPAPAALQTDPLPASPPRRGRLDWIH